MAKQQPPKPAAEKNNKKPAEEKPAVAAATFQETEEKNLDAVIADIKSVAEETRETTDLMEKEKKYSQEVIDQFKEIMSWADSSFRVNLGTVAKRNTAAASGAVLTSQGVVSLLNANGKVLSERPLEQFHTQTVLSIIDEVLPEVTSRLENIERLQSERKSSVARAIEEIKKIVYGGDDDDDDK